MDSEKYSHYGPIDFALDSSFIRWIRHTENNDFWENWINLHPEKAGILNTARLLVLSVSETTIKSNQSEVEIAWLKVHYRIQMMEMKSCTEDFLSQSEEVKVRPVYKTFLKMAVAILLLATFTISILSIKDNKNS